MKYKYVTDLDELSQSSVEIDVKKDGAKMREIILELKKRMEEDNLTALSAPQIGEKYRIFCIKFIKKKGKTTSTDVKTFVNPVVTGIRGIVIDREADVCLPDRQFIIYRNNDLSILYQNPLGNPVSQKFSGKSTAVIQLMMDHLDGVLLSDLGLEIDERFDEATEEEKNELMDAYMKSLDLYKQELDKDIDSDKDLKSMKDAVDFIQSVRDGKTQLGSPITVDTSALQEK